jgi:hypothetical protein
VAASARSKALKRRDGLVVLLVHPPLSVGVAWSDRERVICPPNVSPSVIAELPRQDGAVGDPSLLLESKLAVSPELRPLRCPHSMIDRSGIYTA